MSDGIYVALSGAIAQERALDVTANNVANVGTTGYRTQRVAFHEALATAADPIDAARPRSLRYVEVEETRVDLHEGPLRETGNPLDLAISGDAFFAVQTPQGDRFTRDGSFVVRSDGVITSRQGMPIEAEGHTTAHPAFLTVPPGTTTVSVANDGTLSTPDGTAIGRVRMVRFQSSADLTAEGGAMLAPIRGATPLAAPDATVVSGFLEGANASAISGMNELITASRTFETFQRVIQSFRSIDERTARDLAKAG